MDGKPWISGSWVLEYVGEEDGRRRVSPMDGLPVRQSWLSHAPTAEDDELAGSWDALVNVEQLLVRVAKFSSRIADLGL